MLLKTSLFGHTYQFKDIKEVLGKANEERSGDRLLGLCAESSMERVAAKQVLASLKVADLRNNPVVPYEKDEVTRIDQDMVNETIFAEFLNRTIGELREWILSDKTEPEHVRRLSRGLTARMIAGSLSHVEPGSYIRASKIRIQTHCNTTNGKPAPCRYDCSPIIRRMTSKESPHRYYEGFHMDWRCRYRHKSCR